MDMKDNRIYLRDKARRTAITACFSVKTNCILSDNTHRYAIVYIFLEIYAFRVHTCNLIFRDVYGFMCLYQLELEVFKSTYQPILRQIPNLT